MTHLRHGNFSKRVGALFCALALVLHFAFAPVRARATLAAGALTAVGFAVTVTAFLNLAGIYPFNPDTGEGLTFPEWTDDALQKLIDLYNVAHASAPLTAQTIKSYALGATIAVANAGWNRLRDFVDWIRSEYAPADNVEDVQLGVLSGGFVKPVYFSSVPSSSIMMAQGLQIPGNTDYRVMYLGTSHILDNSSFGALAGYYSSAYSAIILFSFSGLSQNQIDALYFGFADNGNWGGVSSSASTLSYNISLTTSSGARVYAAGGHVFLQSLLANASLISDMGIPLFQTEVEVADYFYSIADSADFPSLSGINADTATVTTPAAPAADSEFTGMQVAGLGQGATVDALEDVIESGVQEREQPTVRQVEVEIQAGTEVDSETGEVTENPVIVDQESVIPAVSELTAPQAFLDALTTTLQTKFPFCLPFDIMRILSAFVKEPQAPLISLTFHDPFSDADYIVSVDLSPWDDVAAIVRQFESMLLLVGFWLNFDKFNVLNIILGQLG